MGLFFEGNSQDMAVSVPFGFGWMELVDVVTVLREERQIPDFRGVGDEEFQKSPVGSHTNGKRGDWDGHLTADFVEETLQVDVVPGLGGHHEVEAGFAREACLLADEPVEIRGDPDSGGHGLPGGRGDFRKQQGFHLVAVAYEGRSENFLREGKLEEEGLS